MASGLVMGSAIAPARGSARASGKGLAMGLAVVRTKRVARMGKRVKHFIFF